MASIDLGCGDNKISEHFLGIDLRRTKHVDIIADLGALGLLKDSSVKIVTSRRVIQHVDDDVQVFKEINRILTPDGVAIIEVAGVLNSSVSKMLNKLRIKKYPYKVFHTYNKSEIEKKIKRSGLKIFALTKSSTKPPFSNHVIIALKGD